MNPKYSRRVLFVVITMTLIVLLNYNSLIELNSPKKNNDTIIDQPPPPHNKHNNNHHNTPKEQTVDSNNETLEPNHIHVNKSIDAEGRVIEHDESIELHFERTSTPWNSWVNKRPLVKSDECSYSNHRDYSQEPMRISRMGFYSGVDNNCDIPCYGGGGHLDASTSSYNKCTFSIYETLENIVPPNNYDITSTTSFKTDVPIGYYSWGEYPYFRQPVPKIHNDEQGLVAAFISNCGPQRRLQWLEALQQAGVKVDSYGSCKRNKHFKATKATDYNGQKMETASTYKFTMSFENSAADDYVTEKLFGILTVGSVPLFDGAKNIRKFLPQPNAAIVADDFGTPEKLAEYLLYLDKNETAYQEHLAWKKTGPTKEWMSIIDTSLVSPQCRICIKSADLHRKKVGMVLGNDEHIAKYNKVPKGFTNEDGIVIYVREKAKFWFYAIAIPYDTTYSQFKDIISDTIPHKGELFEAHKLWSKEKIVSEKISNEKITIQQEEEIE
eukprot:gene5939-7396_t